MATERLQRRRGSAAPAIGRFRCRLESTQVSADHTQALLWREASAADDLPKWIVHLGIRKQGSEVVETLMSPKDILATLYHLLGVDPEGTIPDRLGRPMPVAGDGRLRPELLA